MAAPTPIRICRRATGHASCVRVPTTRGHHSVAPHHASAQDGCFVAVARDRRSRLDRRRVPQQAGQRGLDRGRSGLHLHHRVRFYAWLIEMRICVPATITPPAKSSTTARLRAHRPAGGIQLPLRRHRRCRAACRTSTNRRLLTQQHLDCRPGAVLAGCPGLPGVVDLRAAAWPLLGPDGSQANSAPPPSGRPRWNPGHYHHCDRVLALVIVRAPGQEPVRASSIAMSHPHRHLHLGLLTCRFPTSRAVSEVFIDRIGCCFRRLSPVIGLPASWGAAWFSLSPVTHVGFSSAMASRLRCVCRCGCCSRHAACQRS